MFLIGKEIDIYTGFFLILSEKNYEIERFNRPLAFYFIKDNSGALYPLHVFS